MRTFAPQTRLLREPNLEAELIKIIPPDTELDVFDTVRDYRRVSFSDGDGQLHTGYVNQNFIKPLGLEPDRIIIEEPATARKGWFASEGPKFDSTTGWLAAGLVLVLLGNVLTGVVLWGKIKRLPSPSVHTSCSGIGSYALDPLRWVTQTNNKIVRLGAQAGEVEVAITFDLSQKEPGSEIYVLYRPRETNDWQRVPVKHIDALHYEMSLDLDASYSWIYRIAEVNRGEVTRISQEELIWLNRRPETSHLYVEVLDPGADLGSQLKLRFWRLPETPPEVEISYITVEFYSKEFYEEQSPVATEILSEPIDLGEGRGLVYELSKERDSNWRYVRIRVTGTDGSEWDARFSMEDLFHGVNFPIDRGY